MLGIEQVMNHNFAKWGERLAEPFRNLLQLLDDRVLFGHWLLHLYNLSRIEQFVNFVFWRLPAPQPRVKLTMAMHRDHQCASFNHERKRSKLWPLHRVRAASAAEAPCTTSASAAFALPACPVRACGDAAHWQAGE
jgi:hypothetical protein